MIRLKIYFLCMFLCTSILMKAQNSEEIMEQVKEMRKEADPAKSLELMNKIIKENNLQEDKDAQTIDMLKADVAMDYLNAGQYDEFEKRIYTMDNKFNQTSYLNFGASTLAKKEKDLDVAEELSQKTLDLYNSFKNDPEARPDYVSESDWNRFMSFAYFPYCDTHASVLFAQGKPKEALIYQEKALGEKPEEGMTSSVERYAELLVLNNREEEAYSLLVKMAETGKSSSGMNDLLRKLYLSENEGGVGFDEFFMGLQKNVVATLKEDLKEKMQNIEAPEFSLKDLDGKDVSLSDFRGKTVVIDFWATWCMPCRASFPAMQKIMKQHPEVKFLYIATQEKQDGALTRVKEFISDNEYPFHVLMDEPLEDNPKMFAALSAYKPQGIPAKVLIDPNGRQRFLSIGFSSDTELINEMEAMIQLIDGLY